eukprot:TRINITY_DN13340_c0_g1_i1.p2 TRINITY_DN13340_c0_g1~~TRINITY_DN13340_c0_g1_i1.p2  ORF type:complete len:100 (-),score=25.06 TRINITY_DN13340_c0_g1_i1:417-716(-)
MSSTSRGSSSSSSVGLPTSPSTPSTSSTSGSSPSDKENFAPSRKKNAQAEQSQYLHTISQSMEDISNSRTRKSDAELQMQELHFVNSEIAKLRQELGSQ